MGELAPITPGLQPFVDDILRKQRWTRQRHNLIRHGLPVTGLLVGTLVAGTAIASTALNHEPTPRCGIGITERGDGAIAVIQDAAANAGISNIHSQAEAITDLLALQGGEVHPGQRFAFRFIGNTYQDNSASLVTDPAITQC